MLQNKEVIVQNSLKFYYVGRYKVKKYYTIFFLLTFFIIIFTFSAFAELVRVTSEYANIRPIPDTKSVIIGEAFENDIFRYEGEEDEWIKINMFSGEHRYVHHSLVKVIDDNLSVPFLKDICQSLMKRLEEAEERSILASNHKYPLSNAKNKENNSEFQKILIDRYILEIFQEYHLQPAVYKTVLSHCMEETKGKIEQNPIMKKESSEVNNEKNNSSSDELTEEIKKEIFKEMMRCEDWADIEAMQYYFPGCEDSTNFIEADIDKYIDKFTELTDSCKKNIREKYNITEEIMLKISSEALKKGWVRPEVLPIPSCCR